MALLLGAGVAAVDFNMLAGSFAPAINITSTVAIGPGKKYPIPYGAFLFGPALRPARARMLSTALAGTILYSGNRH